IGCESGHCRGAAVEVSQTVAGLGSRARQGDIEGRAPIELALGPDATVVCLHQLLNDEEAQPGAVSLLPGRRSPEAALENARQVIRGNANALIGDTEDNVVGALLDPDAN